MRILGNLRYAAYKILLYEGVLLGIAAAISLLRGRLTIRAVAEYWVYVGIAAVAVGAMSVYGAWGSTRSFQYQHSASVTRSIDERSDDQQRDMGEAFGFFWQALVVGLVAILCGTVTSVVIGG